MDTLSQTEDLEYLDNVWVEYGQGYRAYYEKYIREAYESQVVDHLW